MPEPLTENQLELLRELKGQLEWTIRAIDSILNLPGTPVIEADFIKMCHACGILAHNIKQLYPDVLLCKGDEESGRGKMWALMSEQGTAASETSLCAECFPDPDNQAYAREMAAQSDDVNPESGFLDFSDNYALHCCICTRGANEL